MAEKCANHWCQTVRQKDDGTLYRFDMAIGSSFRSTENKTEFVWLCDHCAQTLRPKVEVRDRTVTLRLVKRPAAKSGLPRPFAQAN